MNRIYYPSVMNTAFTVILIVLVVLLLIALFIGITQQNNPSVNLPEEYILMTEDTPIKGHFDAQSNTVYIEFDNSKK